MSADLRAVASKYPLAATLERLLAQIEHEGWHLFAKIDHAELAQQHGLALRPTVLLLLGNPEVGTRVMQDNQLAAIDLPMKLLVWENAVGQVSIAWNDFDWLQSRHRLQDQATLTAVRRAIERMVAAAT